jgi:VWFA-related protein
VVSAINETRGIAQIHRPGRAEREQDETIKLRAELVVLDAQVFNKKTALAVGGLTKNDFELYEDGVKQQITHFSRDQLPLSVVILLDVSGSLTSKRRDTQRLLEGVVAALDHLKPVDEVALLQFAGSASLLQGFTRDDSLIVDGLWRINGKILENGTDVSGAVYQAARHAHTACNPDSRRVIIAITDDISVKVDRTEKVYTAPLSQSEAVTLRELYESGSVVCGLIYPSGFKYPEHPRIRRGIVKGLAERTGGIAIGTSEAKIPEKLAELIERLRQRYTIGYTPTNTSSYGKFRRIKLQVRREIDEREGGVAVRTRRGYYAK